MFCLTLCLTWLLVYGVYSFAPNILILETPITNKTVTDLTNELHDKFASICYNLCYHATYNYFYYYSVLEIKLKQLRRYMFPLLDENKNENENVFVCYSEFFDLDGNGCDEEKATYMIQTQCKDKICRTITDSKDTQIIEYKKSNVSFVSVSLICDNETFDVNLNDNAYNYYVVGNCLDKTFFKYYMRHILLRNVDSRSFKYTVEIIDSDINILKINENQQIIINEDSYNISECK